MHAQQSTLLIINSGQALLCALGYSSSPHAAGAIICLSAYTSAASPTWSNQIAALYNTIPATRTYPTDHTCTTTLSTNWGHLYGTCCAHLFYLLEVLTKSTYARPLHITITPAKQLNCILLASQGSATP